MRAKKPQFKGLFVLADANECPVASFLAEAKALVAVTHGECAAAVLAAPYAQAAIYKIVGSAVPFHSLWIRLHAAVKAKGRNGNWAVDDIFK